MARLGGMSTESFSSARERLSAASIGLGSILRDQKVVPGTSRMNVLLGLSSSQTGPAASRSLRNSPVHSLSSSPIETNGFLDVDDGEPQDDDIWGMNISESGGAYPVDVPWHRQRLPHAYELGSSRMASSALPYNSYGPTHTHSPHNQKLGVVRAHLDAPKQRPNMGIDGTWSAQQHLVADRSVGLTDTASTDAGPAWLFPRSKDLGTRSVYSHAYQSSTPSRSIPQIEKRISHDSEHQSAPVNVPNWSKISKKDSSSMTFTTIEKIGEDDEERLPPHEMLAKEYARNQRMTSSVCEGQGRTLKGRDMRRVRNAVWRQTGFVD